MIRRILAMIGTASAAVLFLGGSAQAAPGDPTYPAPPPAATVSKAVITSGETVTFSGSGFTPNEGIGISVTTAPLGSRLRGDFPALAAAPVTTTAADGNGAFSVDIRLTDVGIATLTALGLQSGVSASATVRVEAAKASSSTVGTTSNGSDLASTGTTINIGAMIAIGAGVLALGLVLAILGARGTFGRRSRDPAERS